MKEVILFGQGLPRRVLRQERVVYAITLIIMITLSNGITYF